MKLLICLITYNRLEYTKRTLNNIEEQTKSEYDLWVVDNHSTDGTRTWLENNYEQVIFNDENYYPGRACNQGWAEGLKEDWLPADYLVRLDNDMSLEPGWDLGAKEYFDYIPPLGQLGLDHSALDTFNGDMRYITEMKGLAINAWPGNIGGPCIIRRRVYDQGARYDETPWKDERTDPTKMITPQEDVKFSLSMHNYGYIYGHPTEKLATTFANESNRDEYPEYYKQTFKERGYTL